MNPYGSSCTFLGSIWGMMALGLGTVPSQTQRLDPECDPWSTTFVHEGSGLESPRGKKKCPGGVL